MPCCVQVTLNDMCGRDSRRTLRRAQHAMCVLTMSRCAVPRCAVQVPFHEVDAHNIVPVWVASGGHTLAYCTCHRMWFWRSCLKGSKVTHVQQQQHMPGTTALPCSSVTADKREYAARTIRPKIHSKLPEFLQEFPELPEQASIAGPCMFPLQAHGAAEPAWPAYNLLLHLTSGSRPDTSQCNAALHGRQSLPMLPGQLVAMLRTWVRWLHSLLTMAFSALLQPAWEGTKPEPIDWDALIQEVR